MTPYKRPCFSATAWKNEMKKINVLRQFGLAGLTALLAFAAAPALAQVDDGYWYLGAGLGQATSRIDIKRIDATLLAEGLTPTGTLRYEHDTAFKLFGGYQLNRNFGLDFGYFNLGKYNFRTDTAPAGTLTGRIEVQGINLDLVGTLPLIGGLSAIGRVGAQYARTRDHFSGSGAITVLIPNPSTNSVNYKFGAGLQYEFTQSFLLRAEAERYRINDAVGNKGDVNMYSVSLVFPFGRTPTPAPRAAEPIYVPPAPAPVVAAPAPAPVVAAPAPAPVVKAPERRRVVFSADALFAFGRSEIKPEGRDALDKFAKELVSTRFEIVTVEGHTDRIGSEAYNQKLSERRAEAVRSYLVTSGVDANKVRAIGKGKSSPVTKPGDCEGTKRTAKLITCLQPDRRVEVEVTGTQAP